MLEQTTPCSWQYNDYVNYAISFTANWNGYVRLQLGHPPLSKIYFLNDRTEEPCALLLENRIVCDGTGIAATGGYAIITDGIVDDGLPELLADTYGMSPTPQTLFDTTQTIINDHSVKLASAFDHSNILIQFSDPDFSDYGAQVFGGISPDATGLYVFDGIFNGKMSYKKTTTPTYYIYWFTTGVSGWGISTAKSVFPPWVGWHRPYPLITGPYFPSGGCTGIAIVTLVYRPVGVYGLLTPEAVGEFHYNGIYNGKESYQRIDGSYEIYWHNMYGWDWLLEASPKGSYTAVWGNNNPNLRSVYQPVYGGITGTPVVHDFIHWPFG